MQRRLNGTQLRDNSAKKGQKVTSPLASGFTTSVGYVHNFLEKMPQDGWKQAKSQRLRELVKEVLRLQNEAKTEVEKEELRFALKLADRFCENGKPEFTLEFINRFMDELRPSNFFLQNVSTRFAEHVKCYQVRKFSKYKKRCF